LISERKIFVNSTEIFNRLRDKRNWIAEYSRIKASFSHELLLMLKSENIKQENPCEFIKNDKILENTKNLSSKIYQLTVNEMMHYIFGVFTEMTTTIWRFIHLL
jgi:hypothetical protein